MLEVEAIREVRRFSSLQLEQQEWLARQVSRRTYSRGETILEQGAESNELKVIQSGFAKVCRIDESGNGALLQIFGPGEVLGEIALIRRTRLPVSAVALTPTQVLRLDLGSYHALRSSSREFLETSLDAMAGLTESYMDRIAGFRGETVEKRLMKFFEALCEKLGRDRSEGIVLPFQLTRADLASAVDSRVETVIRIMSRWEKEGLVVPTVRGFRVARGMWRQPFGGDKSQAAQ